MAYVMARTAPDGLDNTSIARRLRILRHHIAGSEQGSQLRFATQMGIEYRRWNNFERGYPLNREIAVALIRKVHGLTLDWLYLGREDGLSIGLHRELTEAGKAVTLLETPDSGSSMKATKSRK
jgi:hypothetical protein